MIKGWINKLFKNEDQAEDLYTPVGAEANFVLVFENLTIGYLKHSDNKWTFEYSTEFKNQTEIEALTDFPHKDKKYETEHLSSWPFFAHRIPGLGQPRVQEIIKKEKLNPRNEIDLLKRFGQRSITNPFELTF